MLQQKLAKHNNSGDMPCPADFSAMSIKNNLTKVIEMD
jgi:hypothetical protein